MLNKNLTHLSKTISHALRHKPEEYGLTLDAEGWVEVEALLATLRKRRISWSQVSQENIVEIIDKSDKQRFELSNGRIRAFYGHSTDEKVEKEPSTPPVVLYHGTTAQAATAILKEGLKAMKRQYVHLSTDERTARVVALRRTRQPVILRIDAQRAYEQGINFYVGNENIWLADPIPPIFLATP